MRDETPTPLLSRTPVLRISGKFTKFYKHTAGKTMLSSTNNGLQTTSASNSLINEYDDAVANTVSKSWSNCEKNEEYKIGDIIFAKLGKNPFWPSIVCLDPQLKIYIKPSLNDEKKFKIHVRFCNDHGRRNWVEKIKKFDKDDNNLFSNYPHSLSQSKNKKLMNQWIGAIHEAIYWLSVERETRMVQFFSEHNLNMDIITSISITDNNISSTSVNVINSGRNTSNNEPVENIAPKRKQPVTNTRPKKRIRKTDQLTISYTININETTDTNETIEANLDATRSESDNKETGDVHLAKFDPSTQQRSNCLLKNTRINSGIFNMCRLL